MAKLRQARAMTSSVWPTGPGISAVDGHGGSTSKSFCGERVKHEARGIFNSRARRKARRTAALAPQHSIGEEARPRRS